MAVKELSGERTIDFGLSSITAKRAFKMDWDERFSSDLPVFNESHPDASINPDLEKCRVVRKIIEEFHGTDGARDGSGPTRAKVTVEYSTRPSGVVAITATTISFADTDPDTILDSGSGFIDAGFKPGVITVVGSVSNDGTYTIDTDGVVDGTLTLVAGDALTPESAGALVTITQENAQIVRSFELGAQVLMQEADGSHGFETTLNTSIGIAFVDSDPDTITDSAAGFEAFDTTDKIVVSGSANNDGVYKVASVAAGTLTLDSAESLTAEAAGAVIKVSQGALLEKPISIIFVQGVLTASKSADTFPFLTAIIKDSTIAFVDSNPDTITDSNSGFVAAGFTEGPITVVNSLSNDGEYTIDTGGVAAGTLTLVAGDTLTAEGAAAILTISQGPFSFLIGKVNNDVFYGKPAETFLFLGTSMREVVNETGDSKWVVDFRLKYNKEGWNKFWNKDTSSFEKVNPEPYETGDFDLLDIEVPA